MFHFKDLFDHLRFPQTNVSRMYSALTFHSPEEVFHMRHQFLCMIRNRKLQAREYQRTGMHIQLGRPLSIPPLRCPFPVRPNPVKPPFWVYDRPEQSLNDYTNLSDPRTGTMYHNQAVSLGNVTDTCREPYYIADLENDSGTRNELLTPTISTTDFKNTGGESVDLKRSFSCPQCKYTTDRKNNLKRHIITMHFDCDRKLECCGANFRSKAKLREHVILFHKDGYRCMTCNRIFCRKALLRRHMAVHSGRKDFLCNQCDYATSHKSNLERHQKVHIKSRESQQDGGDVMVYRSQRRYSRKCYNSNDDGDALFRRLTNREYEHRDKNSGSKLDERSQGQIENIATDSDKKHAFNAINNTKRCVSIDNDNETKYGKSESNISPSTSNVCSPGLIVEPCSYTLLSDTNRECCARCTVDENCNTIVTDRVDIARAEPDLSMEELDKNTEDLHETNNNANETLNETLDKLPNLFRKTTGDECECTIVSTMTREMDVNNQLSNVLNVQEKQCNTEIPCIDDTNLFKEGPCKVNYDIDNKYKTHSKRKSLAVDVIKDKYSRRLCILPYRCASCKTRYKAQNDFLSHICSTDREHNTLSSGSAFSLVATIIKMGSA